MKVHEKESENNDKKNVLDELKNIRVSKANAKEPMTIHRIENGIVNKSYTLIHKSILVSRKKFTKLKKLYLGWQWQPGDQVYIEKNQQYEEDKANNYPMTVLNAK